MDEEKTMEVVKREPLNITLANGIKPKDYSELMQFASLYANSGLAPKSFQSVPQLAIAMTMCLELGRPIITGLADMAVINGKVAVYGDLPLAMVRSSGLLEFFEEKEEGKPYTDEWTFTCTVKRKGMPSRAGIWSWLDSKRAGYDKVQAPSPWARFTRRMMQFKARNFPLRDEFGDVLKGMKTIEEVQDIIELEPDAGGTFGQQEQTGDQEKADKLKAIISKPVAPPQEDKVIAPEPGLDFDPEIAKEYIHKRVGEKGTGGLMSWVTANADKIVCYPQGNYMQLKEKFAAMYGVGKWPVSLEKKRQAKEIAQTIEAVYNEKEVDPPWEEDKPVETAPDPEEYTPPDCCKPCGMEKCNGRFDLYFENSKGETVCLHSPTYKQAEYVSPEPEPVKEEVKPELKNGVDSIVCLRTPQKQRKLASFCAKCIESDTCGSYQTFLKKS
jgi:hypothetical protein